MYFWRIHSTAMKLVYQNHVLFPSICWKQIKLSDSSFWQISPAPIFKSTDVPESYSILVPNCNTKKSGPKKQCYHLQNPIVQNSRKLWNSVVFLNHRECQGFIQYGVIPLQIQQNKIKKYILHWWKLCDFSCRSAGECEKQAYELRAPYSPCKPGPIKLVFQ